MRSDIKAYYTLLDLAENASVDQIKKAYRAKVKIYHPDVNKDPAAKQKFIEFTEAYDVLLSLKTKGFSASIKNKRNNSTKEAQFEERKQQAKERATHHAKMRYEEFINSDYYIANNAFDILLDHFMFALSIFIILILPVILFIHFDLSGLFVGIAIALLTLPMNIRNISSYDTLSIREFISALKIIQNYKAANFVFFIALNIILFFTVALPI